MEHNERFKGLLSLPGRAKSPQEALSSRIPKHSLQAFRTQLWQTWALGRQPLRQGTRTPSLRASSQITGVLPEHFGSSCLMSWA